ncbi:MAG: flagellar filament outer layer protein FlaA [Anaerolineae bacterium]
MGGQPDQIRLGLWRRGRPHFLNVWVKDSAGETRQYSFGQVKHTGWQQMIAPLIPINHPGQLISGRECRGLDYPLSFQATGAG